MADAGLNHWSRTSKREETVKKVVAKTKGRHLSPTSEFKKGHTMSQEVREKISQTMKGMRANNLGKHHTLATRRKLSEIQKSIREKHWCWKGGIYPENKLIRRSFEYRDWIQKTFKRDDYVCQICGERGGKLNSHHIHSFSEHEELRINISNGITLCRNCHFSLVNGHENEWISYFNFNLETRDFEYVS